MINKKRIIIAVAVIMAIGMIILCCFVPQKTFSVEKNVSRDDEIAKNNMTENTAEINGSDSDWNTNNVTVPHSTQLKNDLVLFEGRAPSEKNQTVSENSPSEAFEKDLQENLPESTMLPFPENNSPFDIDQDMGEWNIRGIE